MKKLSEKRKKDYFKQLLYFHDHPNCEVCGKKAVDCHHIIYRSEGGKSDDDNLISLCRQGHKKSHFLIVPYLSKEDLWRAKGLDLAKMDEKYRVVRMGCKQK